MNVHFFDGLQTLVQFVAAIYFTWVSETFLNKFYKSDQYIQNLRSVTSRLRLSSSSPEDGQVSNRFDCYQRLLLTVDNFVFRFFSIIGITACIVFLFVTGVYELSPFVDTIYSYMISGWIITISFCFVPSFICLWLLYRPVRWMGRIMVLLKKKDDKCDDYLRSVMVGNMNDVDNEQLRSRFLNNAPLY